MRKKWVEYVEPFRAGETIAFDSSVFNDPVAMQTSWGALEPGGSSSRAVKQVVTGDGKKIRYYPTLTSLLFVSGFTLACPLIWLFLKSPWRGSGQLVESGFAVTLALFSVIFFIAGVFWLKSMLTKKTIDLSKGQLVFGKRRDALESIHAIQIVPERIKLTGSTGDPGTISRYYISYELNLVYKDASRINLMDHGDYEGIKQAAEVLSDAASWPIWDMVEKDSRL